MTLNWLLGVKSLETMHCSSYVVLAERKHKQFNK
jgi:hypothetical protein